jgi:hypothetical protein
MGEFGSGAGTSYPAHLDTRRVEVNFPTAGWRWVNANWANDITDALVSIQNAIGTNPQGALSSLRERVDSVIQEGGGLKSGVVTDDAVSDAANINPGKIELREYATIRTLERPELLVSETQQSSFPWKELDLLPVTAPGVTSVVLSLELKDELPGQAELGVRMAGSGEEEHYLRVYTQVANRWNGVTGPVKVDSNGKCEYFLSALGTSTASYAIRLLEFREVL